MNILNSLQNKIILLTGASRGIGRAVAIKLAQQGATIILLSRDVNALQKLSDEIVINNGSLPGIYPFNLCSATPTDYDDLRLNISKAYGRLDGIIHNAGILGSLTPLEYYDVQTWYQVLQVNLNSVFLLNQATMPLLKLAKAASILFTVTVLTEEVKANWGAYAISSNACLSMMKMLASECENITNIRVNAIKPNRVNTKLRSEAYPAEDQSKLLLPQQIVSKYIYLMSDESKHLNGHVITADTEIPATALC